MISRFFIDRPIFASVIAIISVIAGLVAAKVLPVAQYPEIAPPTVTITASYPGASAETIAKGRAVTAANNCVACHTATLVGQQQMPRLAGQHKPYLLAQLKAFKAGTRGDLDGTMTSAAQGLVVEELDMLADYLSTLQVP